MDRVRRVMLWSAVAVVVAVTLFMAIGIGAVLLADCAEASSEVGDPCVVGRASYASWTLLVWAAVALPLSLLAAALRRRLRTDHA